MSNIDSLKGKKILITSFSYASFGGAELNAVELADQLVQFGMKPIFFSYDIDGPLRSFIEKKFKTKVLTDQINRLSESEDENEMGITKLNISDYDYVWVGGNTIPISILRQINSAKKVPKFIFIHMSSLIAFPLDAPLLPEFEKKIASKILSIGDGTTNDGIYRILGKDIPLGKWYNPAPKEFRYLKKRNGELKRIAVISSSHPTDEIMSIKEAVESKGITIDYIGSYNNNPQVVDAKFYDKYDLIIGIGKNAKYSLVSGVPIYVYGRFGGCGYLSGGTYYSTIATNFSGRGFGKKNARTITDEILTGYHSALRFHETHRDKFIKEFSLDNVARDLFIELEQQKNISIKFEERYINWLVSMQINLMQRHMRTVWLRREEKRVHKFELENHELKRKISLLKLEVNKLRKDIRDIYNSRSWRATKPMREVIAFSKEMRNKSAGKRDAK